MSGGGRAMIPSSFNSSYVAVFLLGSVWGAGVTESAPWLRYGAILMAFIIWFATRRLLADGGQP